MHGLPEADGGSEVRFHKTPTLYACVMKPYCPATICFSEAMTSRPVCVCGELGVGYQLLLQAV